MCLFFSRNKVSRLPYNPTKGNLKGEGNLCCLWLESALVVRGLCHRVSAYMHLVLYATPTPWFFLLLFFDLTYHIRRARPWKWSEHKLYVKDRSAHPAAAIYTRSYRFQRHCALQNMVRSADKFLDKMQCPPSFARCHETVFYLFPTI